LVALAEAVNGLDRASGGSRSRPGGAPGGSGRPFHSRRGLGQQANLEDDVEATAPRARKRQPSPRRMMTS
jgi:hypothetical protein